MSVPSIENRRSAIGNEEITKPTKNTKSTKFGRKECFVVVLVSLVLLVIQQVRPYFFLSFGADSDLGAEVFSVAGLSLVAEDFSAEPPLSEEEAALSGASFLAAAE